MPGVLKWFTRWMSKPNTLRGEMTNRARWKVRGQWKVGEDVKGNEFYIYQPFEETPIRRMCIYKDGQLGLDDLHFLWYQWVRYQRNFPPTNEELAEYDEYLEDMKQKALEFETRDRKQRKEEAQFVEQQRKAAEAEKRNNQIDAQQEIMSMFAEREKALRVAAEQKMARMKVAEDAMKLRKEEQDKIDKMKLEVEWRAGGLASSGSGGDFRPGAWRPDATGAPEASQTSQASQELATPAAPQTPQATDAAQAQTPSSADATQTSSTTPTSSDAEALQEAKREEEIRRAHQIKSKTLRQPWTPPKSG